MHCWLIGTTAASTALGKSSSNQSPLLSQHATLDLSERTRVSLQFLGKPRSPRRRWALPAAPGARRCGPAPERQRLRRHAWEGLKADAHGRDSYGASLRKQVKKMEITQHAKYTCTFCGKTTVRRHSTGIWNCKSCKRTMAGGAYVVAYVFASLHLRARPNGPEIHRQGLQASSLLTMRQHARGRCHAVDSAPSEGDCRGLRQTSFRGRPKHRLCISVWCTGDMDCAAGRRNERRHSNSLVIEGLSISNETRLHGLGLARSASRSYNGQVRWVPIREERGAAKTHRMRQSNFS